MRTSERERRREKKEVRNGGRIGLKYAKKFVNVEIRRVLISGYAKFNLLNSVTSVIMHTQLTHTNTT